MGNCLSSHQNSNENQQKPNPSKKQSELPRSTYADEVKSECDLRDSFNRRSTKKKAIKITFRDQAETGQDAPNAVISDRVKTEKDNECILEALGKHFVFKGLRKELHQAIVSHMNYYELGPAEVIFEQNQSGNNFFVVESGDLEVIINGNRVKVLHPGDSFGELALLHDSARSATVKSITKTGLWGLARSTFRKALEKINATYYEENKNFVNTVPLFNILTPKQKETLVFALSSFKFADRENIVNEGDPGDLLYIIKEGFVICTQKGVEIRRMNAGEYFGDQALLYGSARTATITANGNVTCIAIGREKLIRVLGNNLHQIIYKNSQKIAIDKSKSLSQLTTEQTNSLIAAMEIKTFEAGIRVVSRGSVKGRQLVIVLKGKLKYSDTSIEKFQCLGDEEITNETTESYEHDVFADEDTDCAVISKEKFQNCIGGRYANATANNEALKVMKKIQLLRGLSNERLQALCRVLYVQEYEDGFEIVQQNSPGDSFFIVKSGKVEVYKDGQMIRTIKKLDYFGERSLMFDKFRSATVKSKGHSSCWILRKSDFLSTIDESMRARLLKRIFLQDDKIGIDELVPVKVLGRGMFGVVLLTTHRTKGSLYALKAVKRTKIEEYQLQAMMLQERNILMEIDHTLILKLVRTFKDSKRLYFLFEYVRGLDLFDVLRELGLVKEPDALFYTSCLLCILEHLHERDIIYRDLKPENVMIDDEGYPKLIDFGTAKIVSGRTYTILGTPHYMAPEIIIGKGYGIAVDYWSLGIMLYEFICGCVPFGNDEEEPYEIYEKILERRILFPPWLNKNVGVRSVIEQLLSKNPAMRHGGSIENLKANAWLASIDWEKLLDKLLPTPYIPELPDLDKEIEKAIKNPKTIENILHSLEEEEDAHSSRKQNNNDPETWDAAF
ncbi:unnamed protein product [Blepharisma stoltei]|uniref:cGMP-dependent protein kinase n=1 Tax=Blepharisma stoltei TaxID=1481888 RepID=A0AAU9K0F0_9CILI|nr:unnamed protein product [Blepharisma stoltei]